MGVGISGKVTPISRKRISYPFMTDPRSGLFAANCSHSMRPHILGETARDQAVKLAHDVVSFWNARPRVVSEGLGEARLSGMSEERIMSTTAGFMAMKGAGYY